MSAPSSHGVFRGICYQNADPESRGRIRVLVPMLFGDSPTDWAWPIFPPGFGYSGSTYGGGTYGSNGNGLAPSVGTGVWVMFEAGNPSNPLWIGVF